MATFRIREVDPFQDKEAHDELRLLHQLTFFSSAEQPDLYIGNWWLVMDETKVNVAFCGLTPTYSDPLTGYLKRVGVLKVARGHGLQRRLITVREKRARKLGMHTMVTDTTGNPASANSLINAGYKIYAPAHEWAFPHSIYWKKALQ